MSPGRTSPTFNVQTTRDQDLVVALWVETSAPLTLTQNENLPRSQNPLYVPSTANLTILADEVVISGKIRTPGRYHTILARVVRGMPDPLTGEPPELDVSGAALPEKLAHPEAVPKGTWPDGKYRKIFSGTPGTTGTTEAVLQGQADWRARVKNGGPGQSAEKYREEMDGEPGDEGRRGNDGGSVTIYCEDIQPGYGPLKLQIMPPEGVARPFDRSDDPAFQELLRQPRAAFEPPPPEVLANEEALRKSTWKHRLEDLPKKGKSLIVVAALDSGKLHFRVFDGQGHRVLDADDQAVLGSKAREDPQSPKGHMRRRIGMSLSHLWLGRTETRTDRGNYTVLNPDDGSLIAEIQRFLGLPATQPILRADGGPGGNGQPGQDGADGGPGGPGAPAKAWPGSNFGDALAGVVAGAFCPPTHGGRGGDGGNGGKGGKGGRGGDGGRLRLHTVQAPTGPITASVQPGVGGTPGKGGKGGDKGLGGAGGAPETNQHQLENMMTLTGPVPRPRDEMYTLLSQGGSPGRDGYLGFNNLEGPPADEALAGNYTSTTGDPLPDDLAGRLPATASYLQMLFERLRARYMLTDPVADPSVFKDLKRSFDWLLWVRKFVPDDDVNRPLLRALDSSIKTVDGYLAHGLDAFGKPPHWAPLLSYDTFKTAFQDALATLEKIETTANAYFNQLNNSSEALNNLRLALGHADDLVSNLKTRATKVGEEMTKVGEEIDQLESDRKTERKALDTELTGFASQVEAAFGLSVNTLLNCMSQLAFTDESNPTKGGLMLASQAGTMLHEGITNVLTDEGEQVKKSYVLGQIKVLKDSGLKAQLTAMKDGFKDDRASYTVLAQYAQFRALVEEFRKSLGNAEKLASALDRHINLIQKRNRRVDYYNELVGRLLDMQGEVRKTEYQRKVAEGQLSNAQAPGQPAMTSFMAGLLERARRDCLEELYLAYRAYAFWALKPFDGFAAQVGESPSTTVTEQLRVASGELVKEMLQRLEDQHNPPSVFPDSKAGPDAMGFLVVLTPQTHPRVFKDLLDENEASFEIEPADGDSEAPAHDFEPTAAAWSIHTPPSSPSTANPFHGWADVRLTRARPWMVGMTTTNGKHNVRLTHLGQERFTTEKDDPFPEPNPAVRGSDYITHATVTLRFIYQSRGLQYDPETRTLTTGKIDRGVGVVDATIGLPNQERPTLPTNCSYAPIGPFGRWRLRVRPEENPGLDLSKLEMIVIDFHGFARSLDDD